MTPRAAGPSLPSITALRALLGTWRARVGLALAPVLGLALWSNTLTDHLGYGAALVSALYSCVFGALAGTGIAPALRRRGDEVQGSDAALAAALYPAVLVTVIALVVLAHGAFAPACGPAHGAVNHLLIPLPGAVLAGLSGLALGGMTSRRGLGTTLAALLVPASVAWSVARFYATPAIFAYDPFYGFFPGALYDERIPLGITLVSYRIGTLGWIAALAALCVGCWGPGARMVRPSLHTRAGWLAVALVGLATGAGVYLAGPALGHRHDASDLARALEGRAWGARCVVVYDPAIEARQARATARDCDLRVAQLEDFYGVHHPRRVTVYLFRDAEQKQSLMGAADTYIAKPWRSEVYLQYAPFPHPVLKHEIAHVVAAAMAPGPLHVTTRGGLLPVPGLIEGAAVAGAWEGESESTPHQWSRAMLEAGMAPRVRTLTGLGFFASASVSAYTAAGSFCRWLIDTRGRERFRRVYASGDFAQAYGEDLPALEREWHAFLHTVPVPERTLVRARTRFRRASVFGRQCPFEREDAEARAGRHLAAGDLAAATEDFARLSREDPTDLRARAGAVEARVRAGDLPGARADATAAGRALGPAAEARLTARAADLVWRWRGPAEASGLYATVDLGLLDEDEARTVSLKRTAIARGGPLAEALRDLLAGRGELDPSPVAAAARLGEIQARTPDPVGAYLLGRQLFLQERDADAVAALAPMAEASNVDARVAAESQRVEAVARYRLGDRDGAANLFHALADDPQRPQGARDVARDWLDRIARER